MENTQVNWDDEAGRTNTAATDTEEMFFRHFHIVRAAAGEIKVDSARPPPFFVEYIICHDAKCQRDEMFMLEDDDDDDDGGWGDEGRKKVVRRITKYFHLSLRTRLELSILFFTVDDDDDVVERRYDPRHRLQSSILFFNDDDVCR